MTKWYHVTALPIINSQRSLSYSSGAKSAKSSIYIQGGAIKESTAMGVPSITERKHYREVRRYFSPSLSHETDTVGPGSDTSHRSPARLKSLLRQSC